MDDSLGTCGGKFQIIWKYLWVCTTFGFFWRHGHHSIHVITCLSTIDVFVPQVQ